MCDRVWLRKESLKTILLFFLVEWICTKGGLFLSVVGFALAKLVDVFPEKVCSSCKVAYDTDNGIFVC